MTQLLDTDALTKIMRECEASSDIPPHEEIEAWGVESEAFFHFMKFFIYRAAQRINEGAPIEQVLGSLLYSGFTIGTKVQLELEMRRIATSSDS